MKNNITLFLFGLLYQIVFSQSIKTVGNISIEEGATLIVENNFEHVSGKISNTGTIKFQGTAAKNFAGNNQTYSGTLDFNGGTTTITSRVRIPGGSAPGTITITGTGNLKTGNYLTLISDSVGTARIAAITSSANPALTSVSDSIVIGVTSGYNSFRFFGNPFYTQLPLTQFSNDSLEIDITGPGGTTNGFSINTPTNNPSAFKYNESSNSWSSYTNAHDSIKVGYGASIYVMNRKGQILLNDGAAYPDSAKISLVGGIRSQDITTNLNNSGAGWNLIANPYPSNINLSASFISGTNWNNVQESIYMYDKKNKSFISYNRTNGAKTGKMTEIIPLGGAFLVQADGIAGSTASITFLESIKVSTAASSDAANPYFLNHDSLKNRFLISIQNNRENGASEIDECVFLFANDSLSTENFDSKYDAIDMKSHVVNIGIIAKDRIKLSISSNPSDLTNYTNTTFPLTVWAIDTGKYSIFYTNIAPIHNSLEIWLKDNHLNKIQRIDFQPYSFHITSNAQSMGNNRFEIFAKITETTAALIHKKNTISISPNPIKQQSNFIVNIPENLIGTIDIQLIDINGRICQKEHFNVIKGSKHSITIKTSDLAANVYTVVLTSNNTIFNNQIIITP
jgi:hypothetical protein